MCPCTQEAPASLNTALDAAQAHWPACLSPRRRCCGSRHCWVDMHRIRLSKSSRPTLIPPYSCHNGLLLFPTTLEGMAENRFRKAESGSQNIQIQKYIPHIRTAPNTLLEYQTVSLTTCLSETTPQMQIAEC